MSARIMGIAGEMDKRERKFLHEGPIASAFGF
jgi:hypothetical protein